MTATAFHVPSDLADLDLTLTEVRAIVNARRRCKTLQNRLDALPRKQDELVAEIKDAQGEEKQMLEVAKARMNGAG